MNKRIIPDWDEIEEPWWDTEGFIELLLDKVSILDILDKYEIEYTRVSAGNFDHKLRCPFPAHQGGQERTASLCVDNSEGNFYCYGCNAHGNTISFLMHLKDMVYYAAIEELSKMAGLSEDDCKDINFVPREKINPEHTIMPYVFKAGVEIREFLAKVEDPKQYRKWAAFARDQFHKMDNMLNTLKDSDWEKAKKYQTRISAFLDKQRDKE